MIRRQWRFSTLGVEATRNVFGRGSRLRLLVLLAAALGSGLALLAMFSWRQLRSDLNALERDGWTTYIITVEGSSGTSLSPQSCFALTQRRDVVSVSAIGLRSDQRYMQLGPRSLPTIVTGVTTSVAPAPTSTSGRPIAAMASHATITRIAPTRMLTNADGITYQITALLPTDLALAGLSGSLVIPVPLATMTDPAETCVVTVEPTSADGLGPILAASISSNTLQVATRRVLETAGVDPYTRFHHRTDTIVYLALGAIFSLATAVTLRSRASELGTYRLAGTSRIALYTLLGFENLLLLGVWAASGCLASIAIQSFADIPVMATYPRQLLGIGVSTLASALIALATVRRDVTSMIKDR